MIKETRRTFLFLQVSFPTRIKIASIVNGNITPRAVRGRERTSNPMDNPQVRIRMESGMALSVFWTSNQPFININASTNENV